MSQLTKDLDQFTDGLMAARMAKIDLDVGDAKTPRLLNAKAIRDLKNTDSSGGQLHFESGRLGAAFEFFQQTGSLTYAVEGLSFQMRAKARLRQLTRRTTLYLILIVLTAIASLAFFWFQLRPGLELIHKDINTTSGIKLNEHYDELMMLACAVPLLLVLAALLWQLFGKTNWFTRFSGGDTYLKIRQQALFWAATERLVESGQTVPDSMATAGRLTGVDSPQQALPGSVACESLQQISSARTLMEVLANQKIESVSTAFPTTAVVIVGGACALICSLATFYPIVRLLDELTTVGI